MDQVAVCICTYKRPEMLKHLLDSIFLQETQGQFEFHLVVVDNDEKGSARHIIEAIQGSVPVTIHYRIQPVKNISMARNTALSTTEADFYACIDDDEFADTHWLLNLMKVIKESCPAGVLGPVRPFFQSAPPKWIVKSRIMERKEFLTGTAMTNPIDTRSGNMILSRGLLMSIPCPFNHEYGRTGGEDVDFFRRMIGNGYRFVWCNEAVVFETIPMYRTTRSFHIERALLRGTVTAKNASLFSFDTAKSLLAISAYTILLPFTFLLKNRLFMPLVVSYCSHIGKALARIGIRVVRERSY